VWLAVWRFYNENVKQLTVTARHFQCDVSLFLLVVSLVFDQLLPVESLLEGKDTKKKLRLFKDRSNFSQLQMEKSLIL
jgi:hypothetical protein